MTQDSLRGEGYAPPFCIGVPLLAQARRKRESSSWWRWLERHPQSFDSLAKSGR